ncbi:hypothetical protein JXB41_07115 [Candidatus Woesearchaeota archaeon]|nr:hypothetical protein [Candidatus Woesearchaeota archaeon]
MKIRYIVLIFVILLSSCSNFASKVNEDVSLNQHIIKEEYKEQTSVNEKIETQEKEEPVMDNIVCNTPYIRIADTCCLDKNNNSICDNDEAPVENIPEGCIINIKKTVKPRVELITPISPLLDWDTEFSKEVIELLGDKIEVKIVERNIESPQGLKVNGAYLFPADLLDCPKLGKKYINGVDYNEMKDSTKKAILKRICITFKNAPKECNTDLCDDIAECIEESSNKPIHSVG